jgi:hypothetical protein
MDAIFEEAPSGYLRFENADGTVERMAYWLPDGVTLARATAAIVVDEEDADAVPF